MGVGASCRAGTEITEELNLDSINGADLITVGPARKSFDEWLENIASDLEGGMLHFE